MMRKLVIGIILFALFLFAAFSAEAGEYGPYPTVLDQNYSMEHRIYDADTFRAVVDIWPKDPKSTSVRVIGYDAPEMRPQGKNRSIRSKLCEKALALKARAVAVKLLTAAKHIVLTKIKSDPYYGRVDAVVLIDGVDIAGPMLASGTVRAYDGKTKRKPWCVDQ